MPEMSGFVISPDSANYRFRVYEMKRVSECAARAARKIINPSAASPPALCIPNESEIDKALLHPCGAVNLNLSRGAKD
jgi:hypothetical protein